MGIMIAARCPLKMLSAYSIIRCCDPFTPRRTSLVNAYKVVSGDQLSESIMDSPNLCRALRDAFFRPGTNNNPYFLTDKIER